MCVNAEVLEKIFNQEILPVITVLKEFEIDTYAKGHQVYKDAWTPEIGGSLDAQIEPKKPIREIYANCIRKSEKSCRTLKERSNW